MKITKFGHCCMFVEEAGLRILTDPGTNSEQQDSVTGIDYVLITHEHADHFHIDSVRKILANNPEAKIITNTAVRELLDKEGIPCQVLDSGTLSLGIVSLEAFGEKHAIMHPSVEPVQNTGYFINDHFFYPGDAFVDPKKPVKVLALPVAGPWMKISEAIDYALQLKPSTCFPVHDGILKVHGGIVHKLPEQILNTNGIEFRVIEPGQSSEF